jgi:hypothetical protein
MSAAARSQSRPDAGHLRARMDELDHGTEARGGRRDHAGPQRAASGASGLDRIVGVMSASGPYDTLPLNRRRGATMGPPACTRQSSPVPFRRRRWEPFAGIICELGGLEGTKGIPDKEEGPGSSPGSPIRRNPGIRCICTMFWISGCEWIRWSGCSKVPYWATSWFLVACDAKKRSLVRVAVRSARALRTPSAAD